MVEISDQSEGVLKGLPGDGVGNMDGLEGFLMSDAKELIEDAELLRLTLARAANFHSNINILGI